jgi:hypothetical protein
MKEVRKFWQWLSSLFEHDETSVPFALGEEIGHEWGGVVIKIISNRSPLAARLVSSDPYWMIPANGKQGFSSFREPLLFIKRGEYWFLAPAHNLPNFILGTRNGKHFFEHYSGQKI